MRPSDIVSLRLRSQQLAQPAFASPKDLVAWFGAMQAQDYAAAKWAIGVRLPHVTAANVEQAVADRQIVRTWPMRGTLHFVVPEDIRWMLALMTPRIIQKAAARHRQLDLDDIIFARSKELFAKALQGGKLLPRPAMMQILEEAGIKTANQRGYHILWQLSQSGFLCIGPLEGKQPTFALLDEWIPISRQLTRDESLGEIAQRYFTSHGPATIQDCAWWTGLTLTDIRRGLVVVQPKLEHLEYDSQTYWFSAAGTAQQQDGPPLHLLPAFDEYMISYKSRNAALGTAHPSSVTSKNGIFWPLVVVQGQVVGTWRRTKQKEEVLIYPIPFEGQKPLPQTALAAAAERYGQFLQAPVRVVTP